MFQQSEFKTIDVKLGESNHILTISNPPTCRRIYRSLGINPKCPSQHLDIDLDNFPDVS